MKFPGERKRKHYFPVEQGGRIPFEYDFLRRGSVYVVGIDQLLVDVEIEVEDEFLQDMKFPKGESFVLADELVDDLYWKFKKQDRIIGEYAGGSIGNTLHNYCVLSDDRAIALGAISKNITVGDYSFKYICSTNSHVDFSYLQPCEGPIGRALCFITPDGERTFGIGKGCMNELSAEFVPESVVAHAAGVLISAYLFRDPKAPVFEAVLKAARTAKEHDVPVILSLGTSTLVTELQDFLPPFIQEYVTVVTMNQNEAWALTGLSDPLLAGQKCLEWTDLVLLTVGREGLYICGHVDDSLKRETTYPLYTKSLPDYNRYEFSRAMRKKDCLNPIQIFTHINPYMGGPRVISNTNGAGDAALSALMHDMSANRYHREIVPNSPKHTHNYLTYSSLAQLAKYANRVSYEVLNERSPRLSRGLPVTADCLEQSYWEK